jgi:MFS family permease
MTAKGIALPDAPESVARQTALPGARGALLLLLAINLFNYIDRTVLASVAGNIQEHLLPDDPRAQTKLGMLSTAFLVTYMIISPIFGWFGDRFSRWWVIGVGVILWSLASGASGFPWPALPATAYFILLLTRCCVGVGEAAYGPVAPSLISDLYPVKVRGQVLSWVYLAIPVGSALGYAVGGFFKGLDEAAGWRWAFYAVVPPGVFLGVICFLMREPPRGQADAVANTRLHLPLIEVYKVLLRTPSYLWDTLGMTAMTFAMGALAYWMPIYLTRRGAEGLPGLNPDLTFGLIIVVAGFVATMLGGWLGDKLRPRYSGSYFLVSGIAMMTGFPMILAVIWTPFPLAWVFIVLAIFFLFLNTGPTNTVLANVTHPTMRATGYALNIFILHALGDAISPPLVGYISDLSNSLDTGFVVVSIAILFGGIFWLCGMPHLEADTQRAPTLLPETPPISAESR